MRKFFGITLICCAACLAGCRKDESPKPVDLEKDQLIEIFEGVYINNSPSSQPSILKEYPVGIATTENDFGKSSKGSKTILPDDDGTRGHDYRFKLVGEYPTLKVTNTNGKFVETQATHVKITDDAKYAFVSYNTKYDDYLGGIVVFDVSNLENPVVLAELQMTNGELSAIDFDPVNSVLYAAGATDSKAYGYKGDANPAFVISVALDALMNFKEEEPSFKMLTSYQGTSVKVANGYVYVTTGDGENSQGGLYILNEELTDVVNFYEVDNARSIDVDEDGNLYLMQAEYARITKFDSNGGNPQLIYSAANEAKQRYAKSELAVWNGYVFTAGNESGMRMINIADGSVAGQLVWPEGSDLENHVTNSVALNVDRKAYVTENAHFNSSLLLLANGGKGIYWYDIVDNKIVSCNTNSIDFGGNSSTNFIASRGNVVFVATGLGGLKILTITVDNGQPETPTPEPETACANAFVNFYNPQNAASLFPETQSVFRTNAAAAVKTLFSTANVDKVMKSIKVTNKTNLYISYLHEGAGYHNSLAFYVAPEGENTFEYFRDNVYQEGKFFTTKNGVRVVNNDYIILPNVTDESEGGPLKKGQMFRIYNYATADGSFNAGDEVVLVLVQDGWSAQNSRVTVPSTNNTWQLPAFMNYDVLRGLLPVTSNLYSASNASGATYNAFKGIQHCAFYTGDCNTIVIAFEDKYNQTDTDYNDIIFTITDKTDGAGGVMNIEKPYFTMSPNGQLEPTNP